LAMRSSSLDVLGPWARRHPAPANSPRQARRVEPGDAGALLLVLTLPYFVLGGQRLEICASPSGTLPIRKQCSTAARQQSSAPEITYGTLQPTSAVRPKLGRTSTEARRWPDHGVKGSPYRTPHCAAVKGASETVADDAEPMVRTDASGRFPARVPALGVESSVDGHDAALLRTGAAGFIRCTPRPQIPWR
jgi:hypothetical protein